MTNKTIKIVKIISDTAFILNAGLNDNISKGTKFEIVDSDPEPILDLDTEETIGYLNLSKGIIIAEQVQEKMTIARTRLNKQTNRSTLLDAMSALQPYTTYTREELNVDETQITGGLNRSNNPIQVGDEVVILEDQSE